MTREQAKQLSATFAKALALEPNEVIRANGMPIINLFAELSKDMPDSEREQVSRQLPQNLLMFEKAKKMNGSVLMPSKPLLEND